MNNKGWSMNSGCVHATGSLVFVKNEGFFFILEVEASS